MSSPLIAGGPYLQGVENELKVTVWRPLCCDGAGVTRSRPSLHRRTLIPNAWQPQLHLSFPNAWRPLRQERDHWPNKVTDVEIEMRIAGSCFSTPNLPFTTV